MAAKKSAKKSTSSKKKARMDAELEYQRTAYKDPVSQSIFSAGAQRRMKYQELDGVAKSVKRRGGSPETISKPFPGKTKIVDKKTGKTAYEKRTR